MPYETVVGLTALQRGNVPEAIVRFERALELAHQSSRVDLIELVGVDPLATLTAILAVAVTLAGDLVRGASLATQALELLGETLTTRDTSTLNYLGWRAQIAGDTEQAWMLAERTSMVEAGDVTGQSRGPDQLVGAWARAHRGDPARALVMVEGIRAHDGPREEQLTSAVFVHADVLMMLARPADALAVIGDGSVPLGGLDGVWLAELHRIGGEALAAVDGDPDECLAAFDRAVAIAEAQGAGTFAQRAAASRAAYLAVSRRRAGG